MTLYVLITLPCKARVSAGAPDFALGGLAVRSTDILIAGACAAQTSWRGGVGKLLAAFAGEAGARGLYHRSGAVLRIPAEDCSSSFHELRLRLKDLTPVNHCTG